MRSILEPIQKLKKTHVVKYIYKQTLAFTAIFLFIICACRAPVDRPTGVLDQIDTAKHTLPFSPLDSLEKYSHYSTKQIEIDSPRATIFTDTLNGILTAAMTMDDTTIAVFKKEQGHWLETGRGYVNYSVTGVYIETEDLNGDKNKDLKVNYSGGSGSSYISCVFILDTLQKKFKHNASYNLQQLEYDSLQNRIRSSWHRGAFEFSRAVYRIKDDGLVLQAEVEMSAYGDIGAIRFYGLKRGKKVLLKTENIPVDKIRDRFDTLLWKN